MKKLALLFVILIGGSIWVAKGASSYRAQTGDTAITDSAKIEEKTTHSKNLTLTGIDSLTTSDYLMSIERVNDQLNSIRDSVKLGFEVVVMSRRIDEITNETALLRQNFRSRQMVENLKNLYLYQSFAHKMDKDNSRFKDHINLLYKKVYQAKMCLRSTFSDSVFHLILTDHKLELAFKTRLDRLNRKWARTDSTVKANIDSLNSLKIKLADNSITLSGVLSMVDRRLDKANQQLFGEEYNKLWEKGGTLAGQTDPQSKTNVLESEINAIGYYFSQTSGERFFVIALGVILFVWLYLKRRWMKTKKMGFEFMDFLHLNYLKHNSVLSIITLLLCLMPFFDAYAPTLYIALEHFLLLAVASIVLFRRDNLMKLKWLTLVILFVLNILTYLLVEPSFSGRLWQIVLDACTIVAVLFFYRKINNSTPYFKWIKRAAIVSVLMLIFGIISNLLGRVSLSEIFGFTGIFTITHAIVLPVFIDTFIEIVLFQLEVNRLKKGMVKPFDITLVSGKLKTPILIVAILLWIILMASNLNIYHSLSTIVTDFLTTPRSLGSISFKFISVLLFFLIIWAAHVMQKLLSFLFGETGVEADDLTTVSKGQHSRLLISRLLVLIGGYLLAIAASGLPIDKLTIVLGALGVGIGMGLQGIVNNFVSGIILIFDGSLQIGDEIEVSGHTGKVKEIGLRASTLNTADGAEVIIPNGNILSQNIVNWTFSNDQKREMIQFTLKTADQDVNMISGIINETIAKLPDVISQRKPVILFTKVTTDSCTLSVKFWCLITNAGQAQSNALLKLNEAFKARNIGFE